MGAIQSARRKFFLRPKYITRHAGDLVKVLFTKRHVVQEVMSRFLFGNPVTHATPPARHEGSHGAPPAGAAR